MSSPYFLIRMPMPLMSVWQTFSQNMSLCLPLHEFFRMKITAKLDGAGSISLSFQPSPCYSKPYQAGNVNLHFDTLLENGVSALSIYASFNTVPSPEPNDIVPPQNSVLTHRSTTDNMMYSGSSYHSLPISGLLDGASTSSSPYAGQRQLSLSSGKVSYEVDQSLFEVDTFRHIENSYAASPQGWSALINDRQDVGQPVGLFPASSNAEPHQEFFDPFMGHSDAVYSEYDTQSPSIAATSIDSPSNFSSESDVPSMNYAKYNGDSSHGRRRRNTRSRPGNKQKQTFPCSYQCPEVFSRKHDRMRHEVMQHRKRCDFVCSKCRRFFASDRTLAKHRCSNQITGVRWAAPDGTPSCGE